MFPFQSYQSTFFVLPLLVCAYPLLPNPPPFLPLCLSPPSLFTPLSSYLLSPPLSPVPPLSLYLTSRLLPLPVPALQRALRAQLDCVPVDFTNLFRYADLDEDGLITLNQVNTTPNH